MFSRYIRFCSGLHKCSNVCIFCQLRIIERKLKSADYLYFGLYLHSQVLCLRACDRDIDTDDDDVWNTGPNPNHEGPGHRERQHCVHTQREEEEKRHLRR